MNQTPRLTFQKGDFLAIILVILLTVITGISFLPQSASSEDAVVQIWQDGALVQELPLASEETIHLTASYENTVQIHDGKVAIISSDCPGTDCVHSGWIETPGRSIVCLPNRVEIRIVGASDVDFAVR